MTNNKELYPIKHCPKVRSLIDTVTNYRHSFAPEEFQRPEAWGKKDKKDYFSSLLMNRLEGNFVVVDLQLAISKLKKIAPNDRAYDFFQGLIDEGLEYIILDGNNRFKFLTSLTNNEWEIPRGTYKYVVEDDIQTLVVGPHNNTYSKLPKLVQKIIADRDLVISEYVQINYKGLSEVFTNVNSGVPLNNQEKRNAFDSPWAGFVRKIRHENASLLISMFGTDYLRRLKSDEWIAECLNFVINVTPDNIVGVTQTSKDKLYLSDYDDIEEDTYLEAFSELSYFINAMIKDEDVELSNKSILRPSTVMNTFWMMFNGIETYEEVVKAITLHEEAYTDSSIVNDEGDNYKWACGGTGAKNNELKMQVLTAIVDKVTAGVMVTH